MSRLLEIRKIKHDIIIYGAGYCGLMLSELLMDIGIMPRCFFDQAESKIGCRFHSIEVVKPMRLENPACVIVAILNKDVFASIFNYLREMGYTEIISIYDLKEEEALFQNQKLIFYVPVQWKSKNETRIERVCEILEDELSRKTYKAVIDSVTDYPEAKIPHFSFAEQYFAYDVYKKIDEEVFVDCGAFRGDVFHYFIENVQRKYKQYFAIEPDPNNYLRIEQLDEARDYRAEIIKYALSDKKETLYIQNYLNENSVIGNAGIEIEAVELDWICTQKKIKPTFIKIDVEGYEQKLLDGAEKIIIECQPIIAIAIYHKPDDLWEIPLRIKKMLPNHRLFLRSYMNVNETILYAIPEERCVV